MANKLPATDVQNAINLYRSGMSILAVAHRIGRPPEPIRKAIVAAGAVRQRGPAQRILKRQARDRMTNDVLLGYDAGESVLSMSKRLGVSRTMIANTLRDAGVPLRSGSEANVIRFAKSDADGRRSITRTANDARRGTKASDAEMSKKAAWKERTRIKTGRGETELIEMLKDRGISTKPQWAFGRYNIDIMCGAVAVEVHSQIGYPHSTPAGRKRIKHLLDAGLNVVYVMCAKSINKTTRLIPPSITAADDVAAFVERSESDPTFRSQYRVIRRTGELVAEAGGNLDQLSIVPVPRRRKNIA